MKSAVVDDGLLVGRRRPAQRRPQPGQQLVHAERLGHVVVGAGVERGDLVRLAVAGGEHDDRHLRPAPQPADDLEPSMPGSPRSRITSVGVVLGRERQRLLAVPARSTS